MINCEKCLRKDLMIDKYMKQSVEDNWKIKKLEEEHNKSLNEFIEWLVLEESKGTMINFEERVRNKAKEIFGR